MSVWGAIAGGFVGTLLLTTALRTGNELNLTRIDLPFLLGTAFTTDRTRAKALGYVLHFLAGIAFVIIVPSVYGGILSATVSEKPPTSPTASVQPSNSWGWFSTSHCAP